MYVENMVAPVKTARKDEYFSMVKEMSQIFKEHGASSYHEVWGVDVPQGERTSFPRAVQLEDDETCSMCTITYPDKAARDACMAAVMADERFGKHMQDMPVDGKRMIFGGFETIVNI